MWLMAEYIEREAAVNICSNQYKECLRKSDWCGDTVAWNIGFGIKAIPAADVAPVVRCKDCKHLNAEYRCVNWRGLYDYTKADDFCSYGEQKEADGK